MIRIYRISKISKILGLTRERYRDWVNKGFIKPTYPADGQGTRPGYTLIDVIDITIFVLLVNQGFSRAMAQQVVGHRGKWRHVVMEGGDIIYATSQLCTIRLETKGIMPLIEQIQYEQIYSNDI